MIFNMRNSPKSCRYRPLFRLLDSQRVLREFRPDRNVLPPAALQGGHRVHGETIR